MRLAAAFAFLALLAFAAVKLVRIQSDFTTFLPESTTTEQRLLVALEKPSDHTPVIAEFAIN